MNRTHYHNCDSLKEGIMSPVISALDLSKHSAHPESWNSFKGVQTKSGKIFFFLSIYFFLIKENKLNFYGNYHENTPLSMVSDVGKS